MYITVEGIDGSGKTTAMKAIVSYLKCNNNIVIETKEPREPIRSLVMDSNANWCNDAQLFLYMADRIQHFKEVVESNRYRPNTYVVSDRGIDSTYAYQICGNENHRAMNWLNQFINDNHFVVPDLTIYLNIDPQIAIQRARERSSAKDASNMYFENKNMDYFNKVHHGFLDLIKTHPNRFIVVNANQSVEDVASDIREALQQRLVEMGNR